MQHLQESLSMQMPMACPKQDTNTNTAKTNNSLQEHCPYTKGIDASTKNICNKHGGQTYFRRSRTLKDILVAPKDKTEK